MVVHVVEVVYQCKYKHFNTSLNGGFILLIGVLTTKYIVQTE